MDDTRTSGTPDSTQDGADAASAASGTPETVRDGADAEDVNADEIRKLREIREKYLAEKDTIERTKQENELLKAQMQMYGSGNPPPTAYDPATQEAQAIVQSYYNVAERDPDTARLIMAQAKAVQDQLTRQENEARFYREIMAIPESKRAEAAKVAMQEGIWPTLAYDRVRAREFDSVQSELAEQRRKLQEEQDRIKRGVVRTTAEPAPPSKGSITVDEYKDIARRALSDPDARKKLRDYDEGRLKIRDG